MKRYVILAVVILIEAAGSYVAFARQDGNRLMEYDTNLNLMKQVDTKIDHRALEQQMDQMRQDGLGCRQMSHLQANTGAVGSASEP